MSKKHTLDESIVKNATIETYRILAEEENRSKITDLVLRTLEQTDPNNVSQEVAASVAVELQGFARLRLEEISSKKSSTKKS